ncbi:YjcZ family sporulation protein [Halobacillus rhizosphaerae]|uniref:YjcZ family sporulation protein n=1 Tax=Halobacillus rhizosphaerae TaxID=3064889 RepID=UPI00398AABB1
MENVNSPYNMGANMNAPYWGENANAPYLGANVSPVQYAPVQRCHRRPPCRNNFILIVVLFILLIIVGCSLPRC